MSGCARLRGCLLPRPPSREPCTSCPRRVGPTGQERLPHAAPRRQLRRTAPWRPGNRCTTGPGPRRAPSRSPRPWRSVPMMVGGARWPGHSAIRPATSGCATAATSSNSSPPATASSSQSGPKRARSSASTGRLAAHSSTAQPLAAAVRATSSSSPSLRSPPQSTPRSRSWRPSRSRLPGSSWASTHDSSAGDIACPPSRSRRSPAAARPSTPVVMTASPGLPAERRSARPRGRLPVTHTSITRGPSMALTSPPMTAQPDAAAASHKPRCMSSTSS